MRITNKTITVLGLISIILIIITFSIYSEKEKLSVFQKGSYLIQEVDVNKIAKIRVSGNKEITTAKKENNGFIIEEKDNYPADLKQINDLIINCLDIKCGKLVTSLPSNYADLGVDEQSTETVKVIFFDEKDTEILNLLVGKTNENGSGSYVRKANDKAVYLTENSLFVNSELNNYLDKKIFEIGQDDVVKVEVKNGNDAYSIVKENGEIKLQNIPKSKQPKGNGYQNVFNALTQLNFDDAILKEKKDLKWSSTYTCILKSGLTYTVDLAKDGEDNYIKVSADAKEVIQMDINKDDTKEQLKEKEQTILASEKAKKFNEKNSKWIYKVQKYSAENLGNPFNNLIEDISAKNPTDTKDKEALSIVP